jgi:hypothetical protein
MKKERSNDSPSKNKQDLPEVSDLFLMSGNC